MHLFTSKVFSRRPSLGCTEVLEYKEVHPAETPQVAEFVSMSIADPNSLSERPDAVVPESKARSSVVARPTTEGDPPTVLRSASSTAPLNPSGSGAAKGSGSTPRAIALALPQAGDRIDCFELEEVIGIGGMGAVFRARDSKLDREVALKLIPQEQSDDPEVVQRFYQEGRSAARLDHENIARVYTIGRDGPFHFIAFEYIAGETLRRRLDRTGPLTVGEAVDVTLQIASALVHASERGVVHRDIKPSNIILSPNGRSKLVDMGLARQFEREDDAGLTQSGMTLGTFDYISPEQARDPRDVDVRSDLYSLGCTLFHMLTGRPPFVGGTVLQKLLQHQEEPPPDIREINAEIPASLAGVLNKLLAKDPDRRYQTPEQLVRDLLVHGGVSKPDNNSATLTIDSRRWFDPQATWVGHMVWAIPVLSFVAVISTLAWWSRELSGPSYSPALPRSAYKTEGATSGKKDSGARSGSSTVASSLNSAEKGNPSDAIPSQVARTDLTVGSAEDLLSKLRSAPPRSVVILSDAGPYRIGGNGERAGALGRLGNVDVTIRPKPGVRPVILLESGESSRSAANPAIFDFAGGRAVIEEVDFVVDDSGWENPPVAIRADDTQLTLNRCIFRTRGEKTGSRLSALWLHSSGASSANGGRAPHTRAVRSHFQGGRDAIVAEGPVDLLFQDCTVEADGPSLSVDNTRFTGATPAQVELIHTSLMTVQGPIFRVKGETVFQVERCAIAPAVSTTMATLITVDDSSHLVWRGQGNFYANMESFLSPIDPESGSSAISTFAEWSSAELREVRSRTASTSFWKSSDPLSILSRANENPSLAFLIDPLSAGSEGSTALVGVRQVEAIGQPSGTLVASAPREKAAVSSKVAPTTKTSAPTAQPNVQTKVSGKASDRPASQDPVSVAATESSERFLTPMRQPGTDSEGTTPTTDAPLLVAKSDTPAPMPPMPMPSATELASTVPKSVERNGSEGGTTPSPTAVESSTAVVPDVSIKPRTETEPKKSGDRDARPDSSVIRTADELRRRVKAMDPAKGGTLEIAAEADFELPTIQFDGPGSWLIEARTSSEGKRPRIRFAMDSAVAKASPLAWSVLFSVNSGRVRFQGLDLEISASAEDGEALFEERERVALFGIGKSAELSLVDCSITIAGRRLNQATVVVLPGSDKARETGVNGSSGNRRSGRIEIRDSFIRSGGDFVVLPFMPAGGLGVDLENSLVSTEGSVIRAKSGTRPGSDRVDQPPSVRLTLNRSTARTAQGLVWLQSSHDEPELPSAKVDVRDSILCMSNSTDQDFLVRIDGHDQKLDMIRDNISWVGSRVAYYQIKNYRRDQTTALGVNPRNYNRQDWPNVAKDTDSTHDEIHFKRWDPTLSAWELTREDFQPERDSNTQSGSSQPGPDLSRIPSPPRAG